jgi:NAD-dependent deacetylase
VRNDTPDSLRQQITGAAQSLRASQRPVVLSGAGISKESGIPTFRDALDGLWAKYDPMELATPQAFRRNPKLVWDWYTYRRKALSAAGPNPSHVAIAAMQSMLPQLVVITQNVDGLHQIAGSPDVITLHGNIRENKCLDDCQGDPTLIDVDTLDWERDAGPPTCPHCGAWVRPNVVWFGENLPHAAIERAYQLCEEADVVLVVGTSGVVQPAASLPGVAKQRGATIIEVNPQTTPITQISTRHLAGPSGQVLPQVLAAMQRGMPDV